MSYLFFRDCSEYTVGMKHGEKIVFKGEADESPDTTPGDLVVVVQQKKHATFTRDGAQLFMKKTITLSEALTGFQFPIHTLDDRILIVKSEPGKIVKPGDYKVIKEEGMPFKSKSYESGDLYIEFEVTFPDTTAHLDKSVLACLSSALGKTLFFHTSHVRLW